VSSTDNELRIAERKLKEVQDEGRETEMNRLRHTVDEQDASIQYLEGLLQDGNEIQLFDETERKYTTETVACVMDLTDLKVASQKVGNVIQSSKFMRKNSKCSTFCTNNKQHC